MAQLLRMPEIAANVTHAVLDSWSIDEGSTVRAGDVLAEIETEKALVEFIAEHDGVLHEKLVKPGDDVEVGAPIGVLVDVGESITSTKELLAQESHDGQPGKDAGAGSPTNGTSPEAGGATRSPGTRGRSFVSPIVRKLAKESSLSLDTLIGTGPNGRVTKRDLQNSLEGRVSHPSAPSVRTGLEPDRSSTAGGPSAALRRIPHTPMRKAIARRLSESKAEVPHFYLTAQCRVDALLALRLSINEASETRISITDFVIKAAAAAFIAVPAANVVWTDESMVQFDSVDMSIAIATEKGLVSPVLRGVDALPLSNVSEKLSSLVSRAHAGRLHQNDLEGGSFAITNLGMFGTTDFTAILNPPQSGILAIGAVHQAAIVDQGEVTVANVMNCTMSVDHRAIDGALAAQWLAQFTRFVENPALALI